MTEYKSKPTPRSSLGNIELDKAEKQFNNFEDNLKDLTFDKLNAAPLQESEPQTKLSQADIAKSKDIYLKPFRSISSNQKFNEDYRKQYEYAKEYVHFTAEHKEIIGENIELWTRPFGGMPAEFWKVPANTPVWGPRYLAERIKDCTYSVLTMNENKITGNHAMGQDFGQMVVDRKVQRLDAHPVSQRKSLFMGANNFG